MTTGHQRGVGLVGADTGSRPCAPKRRIRTVLARVEATGTSNPTGSALAEVLLPSKRVACMLSVAFEPDSDNAVTDYNGATWTITAFRPADHLAGGRRASLHAIETSKLLPRAYELQTMLEAIQVTCALTVPKDANGDAVAGDWVLLAQWEPDTLICAEEADEYLSKASADAHVRPKTLRP